ncbi:hypothetical protein KC726_01805 [Candidatus Woesebacteria bacterium]|nr:hypothetical protein [Candidatus Woesebacteria bacterium]
MKRTELFRLFVMLTIFIFAYYAGRLAFSPGLFIVYTVIFGLVLILYLALHTRFNHIVNEIREIILHKNWQRQFILTLFYFFSLVLLKQLGIFDETLKHYGVDNETFWFIAYLPLISLLRISSTMHAFMAIFFLFCIPFFYFVNDPIGDPLHIEEVITIFSIAVFMLLSIAVLQQIISFANNHDNQKYQTT